MDEVQKPSNSKSNHADRNLQQSVELHIVIPSVTVQPDRDLQQRYSCFPSTG
jgi:hypothetical protein